MVIVKKKRKVIKSCEFCRRRKLKCNQIRPSCSTCTARDQICEYVDPPESIVSESSEYHHLSPSMDNKMNNKVSNEVLLDGINNLQRQLQYLTDTVNLNRDNLSSVQTTKNFTDKPAKNIIYDFSFIHVKADGRRILYGPTSMRTYIAKDKWGFGKKCQQMMSKLKAEKEKWRAQNPVNQELKEVDQIIVEYGEGFKTLLSEVCRDLPSHEQCFSSLNSFFANNNAEIYQMNRIVDSHKVLNEYFYNHFMADGPRLDGERPILTLLPSEQGNYYKAAVVIMILCIVHYKQNIPASIRRFITTLTGLTSAHVFYIERIQFLALRCEYQRFTYADGDDSHLVNLVNMTVTTAIAMGLNRDIRNLYAGQETVVGTLDSLENLWLQIVLMDLECSFQIGKPLCVPPTVLDHNIIIEHDIYSAYKVKLIKFLNLVRPMISAINNPLGQPDLKEYCSDVFKFIKNELPPIALFTDKEKFQFIQFRDIRLFSLSLQMLHSFATLRFAVIRERSCILRDIGVQSSLILHKLNTLLVERCFMLDSKYHPECLVDTDLNFPPYMCLMLYLTNGLFPRVASVFCPLVYHKITRFESGDSLKLQDEEPTTDWDYTTLTVSKEMKFSILKAFNIYCELVSHIANPEDPRLKRILERSQYMNITLAIEKLYRTIIKKTLEFRTLAESSWNDKEIELDSLEYPKRGDTGHNTGTSTSNNASTITPATASTLTNATTISTNPDDSFTIPQPTSNRQNPSDKYDNPEDFLEAITDKFWEQYNVGWEDLLKTDIIDELLS